MNYAVQLRVRWPATIRDVCDQSHDNTIETLLNSLCWNEFIPKLLDGLSRWVFMHEPDTPAKYAEGGLAAQRPGMLHAGQG